MQKELPLQKQSSEKNLPKVESGLILPNGILSKYYNSLSRNPNKETQFRIITGEPFDYDSDGEKKSNLSFSLTDLTNSKASTMDTLGSIPEVLSPELKGIKPSSRTIN